VQLNSNGTVVFTLEGDWGVECAVERFWESFVCNRKRVSCFVCSRRRLGELCVH
jgi:hypothetical protein